MSDTLGNAETQGTPEEVIGGDVVGNLDATVIEPEIAVGDEEVKVVNIHEADNEPLDPREDWEKRHAYKAETADTQSNHEPAVVVKRPLTPEEALNAVRKS